MKKELLLIFFIVLNFTLASQTTFADYGHSSGIDYKGKTYGASWGDINGDGLLDLLLSNHYNRADDTMGGIFINDVPLIYINLGNNQFLGGQYIVNPLMGNDLHGGLIFDFDNDGDNDVLITSGGTSRNLFFVNDGSENFALNNLSTTYNIDLMKSRGRMASVIDIQGDGIVDVILSNENNQAGFAGPSILTRLEGESYVIYNREANFIFNNASHGTLMDMNNDGISEFVLLTGDRFKILDYQFGMFIEVGEINTTINTTDYLLGDFNGDLLTDVFFTRGNRDTHVVLEDSNTIHAYMRNTPQPNEGTSFSFESMDSINISIGSYSLFQDYLTLHLGSSHVENVTGYHTMRIHPAQPILQGFQEITDDQEDVHIFIGRVDNKWKILSNNLTANSFIWLTIKSDSEIFDFISDYTANGGLSGNRMYINNGNYLFTLKNIPGTNPFENSLMGVVGDFDNDMDLDIYVICSTGADNSPNYLLENINNRTWVRHHDAWGAVGDGPGIGESVTVADINNDGFLDLFIGNGRNLFFLDSARYNLYVNRGNENNWLGIKLVGETATRGGYGAVVYAVAGGVKQVRTQNAGEHHRSQNDQRIHFGMAQNTVVDSIIIKWPNGSTQILLNAPVNKYLEIIEE